jgi:flavin-binding protein dodecin
LRRPSSTEEAGGYPAAAERLPQHATTARKVVSYPKEEAMSVARVTEIISSSKNNFEDAVEKGINRAVKTLKNVEGRVGQEPEGHRENF